MGKILLIIQREYISRVRKKTFILMTLLGPILIAAVMIVPIWLVENSSSDHKILVIDQTKVFSENLSNGKKIKFEYLDLGIKEAKVFFKDSDYQELLFIPRTDVNNPKGIEIFSKKSIGEGVKSFIERKLEDRVKNLKLEAKGFNNKQIEDLNTKINIRTLKLGGNYEEETSTKAATIIGFVGAFLIYMFIFMYGIQVMKGVMEEKSNRIIEVIISSVKPFQLMMGKVIGVALVSLTQFAIWILLSLGVSNFISYFTNIDEFRSDQIQQTIMTTDNIDSAVQINGIVSAIDSINIPLVISCFIFYFLGGYLIYSALFAAVGAAVDNDTDTQQFMLPITIPMIIAFMVAQGIITDPESSMAFWFSVIPLTSPIVMMIRVPFLGEFNWEIIVSMISLIIGFIIAIWLSGRIYKVGILMYGKKVSYKEIRKWLFY